MAIKATIKCWQPSNVVSRMFFGDYKRMALSCKFLTVDVSISPLVTCDLMMRRGIWAGEVAVDKPRRLWPPLPEASELKDETVI